MRPMTFIVRVVEASGAFRAVVERVKESLPKSAEFNIYVRDRKPFVRFTGKAYVLPRSGQRGIPLVSVNTPAVNVNVFRIGDRNLGKEILMERDWEGEIRLDDADAMARFNHYTGRGK